MTTLSNVAFVTAHIFGLCMAIFLLIRYRSIPAIFAAIGFGLFLAEDIGAGIIYSNRWLVAKSLYELDQVDYLCGCIRLFALLFLIVAIGESITIRGRRENKNQKM
jgi:hypothetical protein